MRNSPREPTRVPNAKKLVGGRRIARQEPVDDISIGGRIAHSSRSCAKGPFGRGRRQPAKVRMVVFETANINRLQHLRHYCI